MIVFGVLLLVLGFIFGIGLLEVLGVALIVVGAFLWFWPARDGVVRRRYY
jgi:hypothetical protein